MALHPVLYVDDDPIVLRAFERSLKETEFVLDTASSEREALRKVSTTRYDIVACDLIMKGCNGQELLGRIHEIQKEARTLLVTGYCRSFQGLGRKSETRILVKPWGRDELIELLRALVAQQGVQDKDASLKARRARRKARRARRRGQGEEETSLVEQRFFRLLANIEQVDEAPFTGEVFVHHDSHDKPTGKMLLQDGRVCFIIVHGDSTRLGEMLLQSHARGDEILSEALGVAKAEGKPIGQVLLESGEITPEQLRSALRKQIVLRFLTLATKPSEPRISVRKFSHDTPENPLSFALSEVRFETARVLLQMGPDLLTKLHSAKEPAL